MKIFGMKLGSSRKAWVVTVAMGYGHERAAHALKDIAAGKQIIQADSYPGIPNSDKNIWRESRLLYETISKFSNVPVLGDLVFGIFDTFQAIKEFYPKTQGIDHPTLQLKQIYGLIEKHQWGKHLIEKLNAKPLPFIATFPALAFMAEFWVYKGPIFLVVTDADVSRAWAPLRPKESRIRYFVSSNVAAKRLLRYGVQEQNILYTGFPLPKTLVSNAKKMLERRLVALDVEGQYRKRYSDIIKRYAGRVQTKKKIIPTLTFAIGGAGAQEEIGKNILKSLAQMLKEGKIRLNIIVGLHEDIARSFRKISERLGLSSATGKQLFILCSKTMNEYFDLFNETLEKTDVLWTKPSELVFFAALGLPIILSPPLGSQEVENRKWLLSIGAGIDQMKPELANEWLPDVLRSGNLAEAAMQGFVEMERHGTLRIAQAIT